MTHQITRIGDWMQTFSGHQFWPLDPCPMEIHIADIAHSLSMQCRYAGHCRHFYSVAEHSVLLAWHFMDQAAPVETCLWALLHDASEAYLVDVPRPVKPYLAGYRQADDAVTAAIVERFQLSPATMPAAIKQADNRILADEAQQNMSPPPAPWPDHGGALGLKLQFWMPEQAEAKFLATYHKLETMRRAAA